MQIDQLKEGSTLTMKVSGRLDTMTAPQLESEITRNYRIHYGFYRPGIYFQRRIKSASGNI